MTARDTPYLEEDCMRVGLQLPWFDAPDEFETPELAARLAETARAVEEVGFASLWVMDHFFQLPFRAPPFPRSSQPDDPMLECYTTLAFLAAATRRIKLGALATGVIYRHPGVLLKTATTLDVLSGGRAYFGLGAGWYEREARGLGVPFPPLRERFEQLEETLQLARRMWAGDRSPFEGRHFRLAEPIGSPPPLSRPHPPILVGGTGERKTLRLVAQYADACNLGMGRGPTEYAATLADVRRQLDVLRRHCDALGRDYDQIERTALGTVYLAPGAMSPRDLRALLADFAEAGIQHAILNMPNAYDTATLERFGREVIPALADV